MPEIPEFQAAPVAIPEARRSYVSPEALAEPGRALQRTGAELGQIGDAFGRIKEMQDYHYVSDQWADATTQAHDRLQNGIDQAKQSGNYQGFAANLQQQLGDDLQQRLDNAPSALARDRLKGHFATLTDEIAARSTIAEQAAVKSNPALRSRAIAIATEKGWIQGDAFPASASGGIPQGAVDYLRAHPELRAQFDEKYGAGASVGIIGAPAQVPLR